MSVKLFNKQLVIGGALCTVVLMWSCSSATHVTTPDPTASTAVEHAFIQTPQEAQQDLEGYQLSVQQSHNTQVYYHRQFYTLKAFKTKVGFANIQKLSVLKDSAQIAAYPVKKGTEVLMLVE